MTKQLLSLLLCFSATLAFAQNDCCTAVPLFGEPSPPPGGGSTVPSPPLPDVFPCGCIQAEAGLSTWYWFSCTTSGTFELLIKPGPPGAEIDFALYSGCFCEGLPEPVRACNVEAGGVNAPFQETGIASDPFTTFGVDDSQLFFEETVTLVAGNNYYLFLNNIDATTADVTLEFAGTAEIDNPILDPAPPITGPTTVCPGATAVYSAPVGNSLWNEWQYNPLGTVQTSIFDEVTIEWPAVPGTYELCLRQIRQCDDTDFNCITVEVESIPVEEINDVICFGTVYFDGNGTPYTSPGTYPVTYESFLGCDSTVILNLDVAPSEFIVLAELKCEGNCVTFDGQTICESGTYQEVYSNQFGCDSTVVLNYVAVPTESVIEGVDTLSCKNPSIVLDGSMSLGGEDLTYEWVLNGEVVGTDATLTVTDGGSYTLITRSMVGTDECEVEETVEVIDDFGEPENTTASGGVLSCDESTITLNANSTTPGVIYAWEGPGGFESSEQNPTTTTPGEYTVVVTGLNGCSTSLTIEVTGDTIEPEAFGTGGIITCDNPTVILTGSSNLSAATYVWVSQFGPVFNEQNPTITEPAQYTLTVTASNGCTATTSVNVTQNTVAPTATAGTGGTLNCFASEVTLNGAGSSSGGNFTYQWSTATGNIVSGGTSLTPTVNTAGTYEILVTNSTTGCTSTASVSVEESPLVLVEISNTSQVDCFGAANGSAGITASGGDGDFTFLWSNSGTGSNIENLAGGEYSVTVTDGEGCTSSTSVTIGEPLAIDLVASATGQTAVGINDGTATASASGGTPTFNYEWSNGEMTNTLTDLPPGNYSVTVTDENGCTAEQSVTVSEFDCVVEIGIEHLDVSCNGALDGSALAELDSAEPPVIYEWSTGDDTPSIGNLGAGVYSVTATDNNGCEVVASATVTEPSFLNANATGTAESSGGANDGTATAAPTGGTPPYEYAWSNGLSGETIESLAPGVYTVTVTDENGCETEQEVTVIPFGCQITSTISGTPPSCANTENGQASITLTGGSSPFIYAWSNGGETQTIESLPAGTYTVTVLDVGGCEVVDEVTLEAPPAIEIEIVNQVSAGCSGTSTGSATVAAEGGTGTLSYLWPSGNTEPAEDNLLPGMYQVTVTDDNECEETIEVTIDAEDTSPPEVFTQNIEVILDEMGNANISPEMIDDGSLDDCEISEINLDISTFDCSDIGENTVTLTATDPAGNSGQNSAVVTVIDSTPPTLVTSSVTLGLNTSGTATLPPGILVVSSMDNCGPVTLDASPTEFTCDDLGENTITLTATDPSGNETVNEVVIEIVDEVNPSIVCPENLQAPYCDAIVEYEISFTDNCLTSNEPILVEGLASGETFPQGQTTVTYEVTDASGNSATCEFEVNVSDEITVSNVMINDEVGTSENGSIDVTLIGGNTPFTYNWTDEDGNLISSDEDINNLPAGDYTLEVTDNNGCVFSTTYTVDMVSSTEQSDWESEIKIYPNPTSGKLFIDLPIQISENTSIIIYDVIGHVCKEKYIDSPGTYSFDFTKKPSGVYLVKLISGENILSKRIVLRN